MEEISDTRRLTHKTLYISGQTGGDGPPRNGAHSWLSRFFSIFCGRLVNKKIFNSKDKMQVPVVITPILIQNSVCFFFLFFFHK